MKKIGILVLTLVLALGTLGVAYAKWSDTVTINGNVQSGFVCINANGWEEIESFGIPDMNYTSWVPSTMGVSCPLGFAFDGIKQVDKEVGSVEFVPVYDDLGRVKALEVTVNNGYPYYLAAFDFTICNCGTIPVKIEPAIVQQTFNGQPTDDILVWWDDANLPPGSQLEPLDCTMVNFYVGIQQKALQNQTGTYKFTIEINGVQWNEYP